MWHLFIYLLITLSSMFILGLSGEIPPPQKKKFRNPPTKKKFKMKYAKIEFLSISGVIFSSASGGSPPDQSRFAFTV